MKISPYDPSEALDSAEAIAVFLKDALATGDVSFMAKALAVVARAKGMMEIARKTGIPREQLYQVLREANEPDRDLLIDVLNALSVEIVMGNKA